MITNIGASPNTNLSVVTKKEGWDKNLIISDYKSPNLTALPDDLIHYMFSQLSIEQLNDIALVNKKFYSLASDQILWTLKAKENQIELNKDLKISFKNQIKEKLSIRNKANNLLAAFPPLLQKGYGISISYFLQDLGMLQTALRHISSADNLNGLVEDRYQIPKNKTMALCTYIKIFQVESTPLQEMCRKVKIAPSHWGTEKDKLFIGLVEGSNELMNKIMRVNLEYFSGPSESSILS